MKTKSVSTFALAALAAVALGALPASAAESLCAQQLPVVKKEIRLNSGSGNAMAKLYYHAAQQAKQDNMDHACMTDLTKAGMAIHMHRHP